MPDPAYTLARAAGRLSRRLGRGGGTSLPGKLLMRWRPGAIGKMRDKLPDGAIVVSATNGKTTTTRLIAASLRADGRRLVTNPSGANLLSGVATALLWAPPARRGAGSLGLFEVDEAALPAVVEQLQPSVVLLMNLFRDQLDRYGELEELSSRWELMLQRLPESTRIVLNADDPAVAALGDRRPGTLYFGLSAPTVALPGLPHAADSKRCRRCGAALTYRAVYLGHLGDWRCPACGWARPVPDVVATDIALHGLAAISLTVTTPTGSAVIDRVPLPGLHNAYNVTAAVAAATALGVDVARAGAAIQASQAAFGRSERLRIGDRELVLLLVKNPAGANETVRTLLLDHEPLDLVLVLNDRTADGRDISWIWDVDYEQLLPAIRTLTIAGDRAHDLGLRFRYAGMDTERMRIVPSSEAAIDAALAGAEPGRPVYVLPTYTAMLELREVLVDRGVAEAFWHDG